MELSTALYILYIFFLSSKVDNANVSEMALEVALEVEETRKKEARERILESKDDDGDMDTLIYSLDELTQIEKSKKQVKYSIHNYVV